LASQRQKIAPTAQQQKAYGSKGGTPHFATASQSIGKPRVALARIATMPQ